MTKNKIGIFGGTFNPVHNAHIAIADEFIEKFNLDMLYVIPNGISPLKNKIGVSGRDRLEMLNIAFSGNDKVKLSDIELKRIGASYTRDTVAELLDIHKNCELYLLIGDDWIDNFHKWRDFRYILDNVNLVVATRSGKDISESVKRLEDLSGSKILLLGNQKIEISSTDFRGEHNASNLPSGVYEYIKNRGLYGI